MIPYLERELIRQYACEARALHEKRTGKPTSYPLNVDDFFYDLFGLQVVYDTENVLNRIESGLLGCLFPDGHPSPFGGKDKIIAVNLTPTPEFDPTPFSSLHTIAHEGMGHYVLHHLKGITGGKSDRPTYCRTRIKNPLEWQADFAAGELTQPLDRVVWLLDGNQPGEIINLDLYEKNYREFFGANRTMMETRLSSLGYKLINARNPWANYGAGQNGNGEKARVKRFRRHR